MRGTIVRPGGIGARAALPLLLASLSAACADAFFFDPAAAGPGTLAVRWDAALGGAGEAFDQADNVRVRLTDPETEVVVFEEEVPFEGGGNPSLTVEIENDPQTLDLEVEVRMGTAPLFRASEEVVLRNGETTTVTVQLHPVAAAVDVPDGLATLTTYGDTASLEAAAVFATGDTLPDTAPSWSTLDPGVVEVGQRTDGSWFGVAGSDGTARLVAAFEGLQAETTLEVHASVVTVEVDPPFVELTVDDELQLTATPLDARGNPIPGRPATWSSENPSVASVEAGLVRAEAPGKTEVDAEVDGVTGSAPVTVTPRGPDAETLPADSIAHGRARLHGSVNPRGSATQAWFEWGTDPSLTNPLETPQEAVGAGDAPVSIDAVVSPLPPSTTFYFRAVGLSTAGEDRGEILSFTTPSAPQPPSGLNLSYDGGVFVRWTDNSTDETSFEVERAVPPGRRGASPPALQEADFEQIAVVGAGVQEHFDGTAPAGLVMYRVRACSAVWCSDYTPPASIVVPTAPAVVTEPPSEVGPTSARLVGTVNPMGSSTLAWFEWDDNPGLLSPVSTPPVGVGGGSGPVSFDALVENLSSGRTYYYRALAENGAGAVKGQVRSFTTPIPPAVPDQVEADFGDPGVDVFWEDVSFDETHFEIQRDVQPLLANGSRSEDPLPAYVNIGTAPANATTFNDPNPPFGLLLYRVRACNGAVCSDWSLPGSLQFGEN